MGFEKEYFLVFHTNNDTTLLLRGKKTFAEVEGRFDLNSRPILY